MTLVKCWFCDKLVMQECCGRVEVTHREYKTKKRVFRCLECKEAKK